MTIKDILEKFGKRDKQFKSAQRTQEISEKLEKRKLSPDERDLMRRLEEKRQEQITSQLKELKDEEKGSLLKSAPFDKSNMFKEKDENLILKQKNIFQKGSMFLR